MTESRTSATLDRASMYTLSRQRFCGAGCLAWRRTNPNEESLAPVVLSPQKEPRAVRLLLVWALSSATLCLRASTNSLIATSRCLHTRRADGQHRRVEADQFSFQLLTVTSLDVHAHDLDNHISSFSKTGSCGDVCAPEIHSVDLQRGLLQ